MAALEAKQKPATPRSHGLGHKDQVIAERLARLRQENKPKSVPSQAEIEARLAALRDEPQGPIPSTQEMEARLAALQGRGPPSWTPQPAYQTPDTRTQAQQAQDLLAQLTAEVAIDESQEQRGPAASIQNDLHQAGPAGQSANPKGQTTSSLEEKSRLPAEVAVKLQEENTRQEKILALTKRLAILRGQDPDRVTLQDCPVPDSDDAEEELPWCCICNEDATLRCAGCDGDLYCVRCFREGHDAFELKEHQTSAYHPQHAGREY
ncbi:zinc finger FYVE-type containing 19 [Rhinolophus ferrumequinum]|uniref:Zinc finger FYVE-type containing 19 n=1 Tax=Rhinolophus ferrumequinum TaxID=59479 RepID=A0A7J7XT43_RHIFE|nr:zinc finger FYVE-type containing 19 [Rhinolophus ferrumequinum]